MTNGQAVAERKGREGGRWINERPSSEDFGVWFRENMKIDEKLSVEDYVGGVVLIPGVDSKVPTVTGFHNGAPVIERREELSYIPYAKVETRINYFWDLLAAHEDEWVGIVERVEAPRLPVDGVREALNAIVATKHPELTPEQVAAVLDRVRPTALATMVHQLPPGFSITSVPVGDGYSHFLCCTVSVAIYRRADWEARAINTLPIRSGRGTKQVPLSKSYNNRTWADESSLMKAETGALGRALGFAGIFVIPGSGVATAEDMADAAAVGEAAAQAPAAQPDGPVEPAEPPVRTGAERAADDETRLRQRAGELFGGLKEHHPEHAERFAKWAHEERKLTSLGEARGAVLRGVVKKLEKLTEEAQQAPERTQADVPAETTGETTTAGDGEEKADGGVDPEPSGQAG